MTNCECVKKVAGSHKETHYQRTLEKLKNDLASKKVDIKDFDVTCMVEFQPQNPKGTNAIVFLVNFDGQWKEVGTIPKRKIVKVTNALRDHDIRECKLVTPPYEEMEWLMFA